MNKRLPSNSNRPLQWWLRPSAVKSHVHCKEPHLCLYATIALLLLLSLGQVSGSDRYRCNVPLGLDEFIPVPEDNPSTPEKIQLGRQLFFEKRLSRDGTMACASCHLPERAFVDGKTVA